MKTKYLLLATLAFFAFAVPVFASSSTFLSQAQKYINENCSKNKIDNETALLCYLFNKSQEQDASIANINTTLSPIPSQITSLQASTSALNNTVNNLQNTTGKSIHVLDANGHDLGIYMSDNTGNITTVFIPSLNRRATIVQNGMDRNALYYISSDCTGAPYLYLANNDNHVLDIYSIGPNVYYDINTGTSPITINSHSVYRYNTSTNQFECPAITQQISDGAYAASQVNLPFSEPIATPLQFKYQ